MQSSDADCDDAPLLQWRRDLLGRRTCVPGVAGLCAPSDSCAARSTITCAPPAGCRRGLDQRDPLRQRLGRTWASSSRSPVHGGHALSTAGRVVAYNGANGVDLRDGARSRARCLDAGSAAVGTLELSRWLGLQNGSPDGLALVDDTVCQLVEFISYEGHVLRVSAGAAAGETSDGHRGRARRTQTADRSSPCSSSGTERTAQRTSSGTAPPCGHAAALPNTGQTFDVLPAARGAGVLDPVSPGMHWLVARAARAGRAVPTRAS